MGGHNEHETSQANSDKSKHKDNERCLDRYFPTMYVTPDCDHRSPLISGSSIPCLPLHTLRAHQGKFQSTEPNLSHVRLKAATKYRSRQSAIRVTAYVTLWCTLREFNDRS